MSINLGTIALVSALAVGGGAAYQYHQPAGPPQDSEMSEPADNNGSTTDATAPLDCNALMSHHEQMITSLKSLDDQADTLLQQMKSAQSDRAKLEATMALTETLLTQRKEIRDRTMAMEHETIQFLLASKGADLSTSCPKMTEWLQQGSDGVNTTDLSNDQGGPDDAEIYNEQTPRPNAPKPEQNGDRER
jgi:hypothetical protein